MLAKPFKYLNISDIHFFHKNTPTEYICESLTHYFGDFQDTSRFTDLDMILIGGDITDDRRDYKDPDVFTMNEWFYRLMVFCVKHSIALRILRGTPSHEYDQSKNLMHLAKAFGDKLDFLYVDTLYIEHYDKFDMDILYVPDEWAASAAKCQEQVQELLKQKDLTKVDIACMHGMFDYQLPDVADHLLKHDSSFYLEIVRYFINIGHVHIASTFDRILAQGSFDRLAHGEEAKKGGILCTIHAGVSSKFEFIENTKAKIYKTVSVKTKDIEKGLEQVSKVASSLPDDSHIRIMTTKDNPIVNSLQAFKLQFPLLYWKIEKKDEDEKDKPNDYNSVLSLDSKYQSISITSESIVDQILGKISGKQELDGKQYLLLKQELELLL